MQTVSDATHFYFLVETVSERKGEAEKNGKKVPFTIISGTAQFVCDIKQRNGNTALEDASVMDAQFECEGSKEFNNQRAIGSIRVEHFSRDQYAWTDESHASALEKESAGQMWPLPPCRFKWKQSGIPFVWRLTGRSIAPGNVFVVSRAGKMVVEAFNGKEGLVVKRPALNLIRDVTSVLNCDGSFALRSATIEQHRGICARDEIPNPPVEGARFVGRLTGATALNKILTWTGFGQAPATARLEGDVSFTERRADGTYNERALQRIVFAGDVSTSTFAFAQKPDEKVPGAVAVDESRKGVWDVLARSVALVDGMCVETFLSLKKLEDHAAANSSMAGAELEWGRFVIEKMPANNNFGNLVMPLDRKMFSEIFMNTTSMEANPKIPLFEDVPVLNKFVLFQDAPFHLCTAPPVAGKALLGQIESGSVHAYIIPMAKTGDDIPALADAAKTPLRTFEQLAAFTAANAKILNGPRVLLLLIPNSAGEWQRLWNAIVPKAVSKTKVVETPATPATTPAPAKETTAVKRDAPTPVAQPAKQVRA